MSADPSADRLTSTARFPRFRAYFGRVQSIPDRRERERSDREMVKIRLTRAGAKKRPFYRIIAIDERRQRDGRPLEFLGTYDPKTNPERVLIRTEAIDAWLKKGAKLSPTVKSLMRRSRRVAAGAGGTS